MNTILAQKAQKNTSKYECKLCDFFTCNKSHFNRHIDTIKHQKQQNNTNSYQNTNKNTQKAQDDKYYCDCGKSYKHKPNFYAHRKKCKIQNKEIVYNENNLDYKNQNSKKYYLHILLLFIF